MTNLVPLCGIKSLIAVSGSSIHGPRRLQKINFSSISHRPAVIVTMAIPTRWVRYGGTFIKGALSMYQAMFHTLSTDKANMTPGLGMLCVRVVLTGPSSPQMGCCCPQDGCWTLPYFNWIIATCKGNTYSCRNYEGAPAAK